MADSNTYGSPSEQPVHKCKICDSLPSSKKFEERIIELIKDDKELHDATVRLINAIAAERELKTSMLKKRRRQVKTEDISKL